MVAEAEMMISTTSDRCIVPLYPCVSPSSAGVRRPTHYRPTHVLAFNTVQPEQKETQLEESPTQYEEEAEDSTTQAVVWGARCGLQVWRTGPDNNTFQFDYRICNGVSLSAIAKFNKAYTTGLRNEDFISMLFASNLVINNCVQMLRCRSTTVLEHRLNIFLRKAKKIQTSPISRRF